LPVSLLSSVITSRIIPCVNHLTDEAGGRPTIARGGGWGNRADFSAGGTSRSRWRPVLLAFAPHDFCRTTSRQGRRTGALISQHQKWWGGRCARAGRVGEAKGLISAGGTSRSHWRPVLLAFAPHDFCRTTSRQGRRTEALISQHQKWWGGRCARAGGDRRVKNGG